jgi:hypothetical protein
MVPNSRHVFCFFHHVYNEMMVHDSFTFTFIIYHRGFTVQNMPLVRWFSVILKCEFILNICFVLTLLLSFLSYSPKKCSYLSFITTKIPHLVHCQVARGSDQTSWGVSSPLCHVIIISVCIMHIHIIHSVKNTTKIDVTVCSILQYKIQRHVSASIGHHQVVGGKNVRRDLVPPYMSSF